MRKIYASVRLALASVLMLAAATAANAAVNDFGAMAPEQVYEYQAFDTLQGSFTPAESGTVKFEFSPSVAGYLYTSPAHRDTESVEYTHAYAAGKQVLSYNLEIGTTYYFYGEPMDAGSFVIHEGEVKLRVSAIEPSPEQPFSVSSNYRIEVTFNYPVTVGNVFLMVGDDVRERVSSMVSNTTVTCDVASTVMDLYKRGDLKEGDTLMLRILQIKDASNEDVRFEDTGKLEIPFTVCAKPGELVSIENADLNGSSIFDSYYFPDDPRGKVSFSFDAPLSEEYSPTANLSYGDSDNLDVGVYMENIPGVNEGSKATFDFTGRLRRPIDMLPLSTPETQPGSLFVSFANIRTVDGQRVYTGVMSNPTGFSVSFRINTLQYNVAADFTPPRGTALRAGTPLEIWVMNGSKIRFDAVCFEYEENGVAKTVVVPADQVTAVADEFSADDMLFNLTVPEINADPERGIDVTMKNLVCSDGLDHSADVFGDFKAETSAVSEIDADPVTSLYDVFDVTGRCILKGATRAGLALLPKGLYIINGKKSLI